MKLKFKNLLIIVGVLFSLSGIIIYNMHYDNTTIIKTNAKKNLASLAYDTNSFVYLSDIPYDKENSYVEPGNYFHFDKSAAGSLITVNIDNEPKSFLKGVSAWASSCLIYNLQAYDYDYFTAYLGVDHAQVSNQYNTGLKFAIYTSKDGDTWDLYEGDYLNKVFTASSEAVFVKVPLEDAQYLKLQTDKRGTDWWHHWYDDAVYADAKLIKDGYDPVFKTYDIIREVRDYDTLLTNVNPTELNITEETALLKREFVKRADYDMLQALLNYDPSYEKIIEWLFDDPALLKLYLTGGEPDGNYMTALKVLKELYDKNSELFPSSVDFSTPKTSEEIYLEMALSLSLTHSANVGSWITGAPENPKDPNGSEALNRFNIFKKLYDDSSTNNFKTNIFSNLSLEEMRFVMNNIISDEEILWLNNFVNENNTKDTNGFDPYTYVNYTDGYNYNNPKYYDESQKDIWNNKRHNNKLQPYNFNKYNLTYGVPRLWIVFEEGAVCGGISKTGSNIWGAFGVPSSVISQPGHAAYIYMSLNNAGNKVWNLGNDVYGWGMSGKTEKLSVRMPNGWGSGSYAGAYPASYVLLAQAALNDLANYQKSEEILMLADLYQNDYAKLINLYEETLKVASLNFDAWLGLANTYVAQNASPEKTYELEKRIAETYQNYPLPMHDLFRILEPLMTTPDALASHQTLLRTTLKEAANTPDSVLQASAIRQVANYLLNNHDTTLATFSFDGENANSIVLSSRFDGNDVTWQYSLDGGGHWSGNVSAHNHTLSSEEISHITPETGILIRIVGALDATYEIEISRGMLPTLYNNDLENKVIWVNETFEWRYSEDEEWHSYKTEEPTLAGNQTVIIRKGATGNSLPSGSVTFEFTADDNRPEFSYIPISRLNIHYFSSEQKGVDDAPHAIDGNKYTIWHTSHSGNDNEKTLILILDHPTYLSALEYVPRQDSGTNGDVTSARISVSIDDKEWHTIKESTSWENNKKTKREEFEPVLANYVKIEGLTTSGNFMSAAMINLFEDATKINFPTADIEYSHNSLTNNSVTATLTNISEDIKILDIDGNNPDLKYSYTFDSNGEFTFHYESIATGHKGFTTATVNWIDKEAPTAKIEYSTTTPSDAAVTATLVSDEDIIILNNDSSPNYVFAKNSSFTFKYQDLAGNEAETTASVDWITEPIVNDEQTSSSSKNHNDNSDSTLNNNSTTNDQTTDSKTNTDSKNETESNNSTTTSPSLDSAKNNSSNDSQSNESSNSSDSALDDEKTTDSKTEDQGAAPNNKEDSNKTIESSTTEPKKTAKTDSKLWVYVGIGVGTITLGTLGYVLIKIKDTN